MPFALGIWQRPGGANAPAAPDQANVVDVPRLVGTAGLAEEQGLRHGAYVLAELQSLQLSARNEKRLTVAPFRFEVARGSMKPKCCVKFGHAAGRPFAVDAGAHTSSTRFRIRALHPLAAHRAIVIKYLEIHGLGDIPPGALPSRTAIAYALRRQILFDGMPVSILLTDGTTRAGECRFRFGCNTGMVERVSNRSDAEKGFPVTKSHPVETGTAANDGQGSPHEVDVPAFLEEILQNALGIVHNTCSVHFAGTDRWSGLSRLRKTSQYVQVVAAGRLFEPTLPQSSSAWTVLRGTKWFTKDSFAESETKVIQALLLQGLQGCSVQRHDATGLHCGSEHVRTMLIHGPRGVGKKSLVEHVLRQTMDQWHPFPVARIPFSDMLRITADFYEELATNAEASRAADVVAERSCFFQYCRLMAKARPGVVVVDAIDEVFARSDSLSMQQTVSTRVSLFAQALCAFRKMRVPGSPPCLGGLVVIGLCTDIHSVAMDGLRQFEFTKRVAPPSVEQQSKILRYYCEPGAVVPSIDVSCSSGTLKVETLALSWNNARAERFARQYCSAFSPHDLAIVAKQAMNSLHAQVSAECNENVVLAVNSQDKSEKLWVALEKSAQVHVPLEVRGLLSDAGWLANASNPAARVAWSDIGGLGPAKQAVFEAVVWPQRHADAFTRMGIRPPRGVLLYGPPGTGKTLLARAVATHVGARFFALAIPQVIQSGVGESAEVIRRVFQLARLCSPSVVFLDELQAIVGAAKDRSGTDGGGGETSKQLLTQLLLELDVLNREAHGVCVLGATNMPGSLDPALLIPGRFDVAIEVGLPNEGDRVDIFRYWQDTKMQNCVWKIDSSTTKIQDTSTSDFPAFLAARTAGFSGADIAQLCRRALQHAMKRRAKQRRRQQRQRRQGQLDGRGESGASGELPPPTEEQQLAVLLEDFEAALRVTSASISAAEAATTQQWTRQR